jgi:glycolate oxidase FAD binding subunit
LTPSTKLEDLLSPAQISERDGKPLLSPNKSEEISAIARYANQHNLAIEITGAGTKRSWGNAIQPNPGTADILLLDTTHLTGVISHSWQDLTATVAAGTPWAAMQRVLAQHNQQVALDPLWPETATVGGIVATNDSGPMRLKYGSLRDLIIGMTIVLADGTIAKSGGKVVKNVAGYDLHKLMTGAFGTLGVITEVTFRLHPIPQHTQTFTVSAPQATQLAGLMHSIHDSHLLAQAMQLRGDSTGFHLDIQLDAHPDVRQSEVLHTLTGTAGLKLDSGSDEIWNAREQILENKDRIAVKATMMAVDVPHFANLLQTYGGTSVTQAYGIMTASLYSINDIIFSSFREEFEAKGGSVTLLRQYEGLTNFGKPSNAEPLIREIKRQFDPNRTLNPGRFIGGI